MTVAFAIAIAVHEIVAGAIPPSHPQTPPREIVSSARLVRLTLRQVPPPKAQPSSPRIVTPPPVPQRPAHAAAPPVAANAAPALHRVPVRGAGRPTVGNARPVWEAAAQPSAGGATTADAGESASSGDGAAAQGNTGAQSADQPCGFVTFSDPHGSHFDTQTRGFWVDIRMSVHFADGSAQSVMLDYPWYYASEAANPWSDENLRNPGFPTRFQPPPAAKLDSEPGLVKYVAQHSTPDGMTLLRDCPAAAARGR